MTTIVLRAARFVEDFTDDVLAALPVRTLSAAGLILLTLLTGRRPGEAPGLQRGCPRARHKSEPVKKAEAGAALRTTPPQQRAAGARPRRPLPRGGR